MKVLSKLMYLGFETKESKKSGNTYLLAKFMEQETAAIFEFYVPSDRLQLVTAIGQSKPFSELKINLEITSFNGKPDVNLVGIEK
jgi:hypothetical protein